MSAAAAYRSFLMPRHASTRSAEPNTRLQLLTSGALLLAFFAVGFVAGATHEKTMHEQVTVDTICAAPLASVEALRNAGCEVPN